MKAIAALILLGSTGHLVHGFDLARHGKVLLADEDPRELVVQFVEADGQGLQTSSEYWHLVQRFTDWPDAPGWDTALVATSYRVGVAEFSGDSATVPVTYKLLGMLASTANPACPIGVCNALFDPQEKQTTIKYQLRKIDQRWVIEGPQDGPIVNVRFAHDHAAGNEKACVRGNCSKDPVVRRLRKLLKAGR